MFHGGTGPAWQPARRRGSCPAEVILDAPTLAARSDKRRKRPYYFGALTAWVLLFVCLGLYYYQQTAVAQATAKTLLENTQSLESLAPKIGTLAKEQDVLLLDAAESGRADLGVQRDAWVQVLAALNDKVFPRASGLRNSFPVSISVPRRGGEALRPPL